MGVIYQKGLRRRNQRLRYIPLITNSSSGSAGNPLIFDGRGVIIDSAKYLKADDWTDNGDGTWSTATNSFQADSGAVPGWYRDKNGDITVFEVDYDSALNNEGDATWLSATSNVQLKCSVNPHTQYGDIAIPTKQFGINNTGDYVTIKNYVIENVMTTGIRGTSVSNVTIEKNSISYTGGRQSTINQVRAGNGIAHQGNCSDVTIQKNSVWQTYDSAFSTECVDADNGNTMSNMVIDDNWIDRCGGCLGFNAQTNPTAGNHSMAGEYTNNRATNIGYGWCGYKDDSQKDGCANQGRVISMKNQDDVATMTLDVSDNVTDKYAWYPIVTYTATNYTVTNSGGANQWLNPTHDRCDYDPDVGQCAWHLSGDTSIASADASITANGVSTTTITYQLKDKNGINLIYPSGDVVSPSTTLGSISSATDNGDGTHTATLTSAASSGTATIGGTLNGNSIVDTITVDFV